MSHILLVEKDMNLAQMYKSVLENSGFKVMQFSNYKELYKNLNGEGFTAILLDSGITGRTLDFISKVRKSTKRQIPIYVVLNEGIDQDPFLMFGKVTCIVRFPNSGNFLAKSTKTLSARSQFKDILHKGKFN